METTRFTLAVLALLLTPGPTNTLLALAGMQEGLARAARLVPAELLAYLLVVLPLAAAGGALLARASLLAGAVTLGAALWVMWLAARLWRMPDAWTGHGDVTARRVFVTTLLNPKAPIFGLVLLPPASAAGFPAHLGIFVACVATVAGLWAGGGALAAWRGRGAPAGRAQLCVRRIAAAWLALLSVGLAAGVMGR